MNKIYTNKTTINSVVCTSRAKMSHEEYIQRDIIISYEVAVYCRYTMAKKQNTPGSFRTNRISL